MSVFMMTGYIKSVPKKILKSLRSLTGKYVCRYSFLYPLIPLIKPMIITIIIFEWYVDME